MQISDLVFIAKLGNKTDTEGFIPFKIFPKFKIEIFSEVKDFFLLFKNHKVRYVTVLNHEERKLKFDDVQITEDAAVSSGVMLAVSKDDITDFIEVEDNFIGFTVKFENREVGIVSEVLQNKAYDLLLIKTNEKKEIMIPDVENFIEDIDVEKKLIYAKNIEELMIL